MAISGIYTSASTLSLAELLSKEQDSDNSILDTSSTWASANSTLETLQNKKAQNAYGGSASSEVGKAALNRALSEIQSNGMVTFKDIAEYREKLEAQFSVNVRVELAKLGVDPDTEFTLTLTAQGAVQVECDDPLAKEKIQQYLQDNPKVCEDFGYIQALSNLERARQSGAGFMAQARSATAEMQTAAIEAFFGQTMNAGMNYSSIMAQFGANVGIDSSSTASFYTGLDFTV